MYSKMRQAYQCMYLVVVKDNCVQDLSTSAKLHHIVTPCLFPQLSVLPTLRTRWYLNLHACLSANGVSGGTHCIALVVFVTDACDCCPVQYALCYIMSVTACRTAYGPSLIAEARA